MKSIVSIQNYFLDIDILQNVMPLTSSGQDDDVVTQALSLLSYLLFNANTTVQVTHNTTDEHGTRAQMKYLLPFIGMMWHSVRYTRCRELLTLVKFRGGSVKCLGDFIKFSFCSNM